MEASERKQSRRCTCRCGCTTILSATNPSARCRPCTEEHEEKNQKKPTTPITVRMAANNTATASYGLPVRKKQFPMPPIVDRLTEHTCHYFCVNRLALEQPYVRHHTDAFAARGIVILIATERFRIEYAVIADCFGLSTSAIGMQIKEIHRRLREIRISDAYQAIMGHVSSEIYIAPQQNPPEQ